MFQPLSAARLLSFGIAGLLLTVLVACGGAPATQQAELPLLNGVVDTVTQVAAAKGWTPLDSVPAPDAQTVYFTANGSSGPAVYKVASAGGSVTTLASGAPLSAPWGLSI